ncbi:MAG TPA: hypothetical protein VGP68_22160 [Gemmataceae bacterium]|nr:hypothetical protein [Gemmataceae bacterium]
MGLVPSAIRQKSSRQKMAYKSTAKQRLYLSTLGYQVSVTADNEEVRACFDHARSSGRYGTPPLKEQRKLAVILGVDIDKERTCFDAAGKLYQVLLCRAWVFSVYRAATESSVSKYSQTGLPEEIATRIAREMSRLEVASALESISTTDARDGDVFYRMSKKAQNSKAFGFAAERLGIRVVTKSNDPEAEQNARIEPVEIPEVIPVYTLPCPKCRKPITFGKEDAGNQVTCENCRATMTLRRRH